MALQKLTIDKKSKVACTQLKERFNAEKIELIKKTIDPHGKFSKNDIELFIHICTEKNLDPLMRQIYPVPVWNSKKKCFVMSVQTGIDGFRILAERTGKYSPGKATEFIFDENKRLVGATCYVKKYTADGTWHEVAATAFINEYKKPDPEKSRDSFWNRMPSVMIEKVAEARALRRAFPEDFSGLYSEDEMHQAQPSHNEQTISTHEFQYLDEIIGDDFNYRKHIMEFLENEFKITKLEKMSVKTYEKILPVAKARREKRLEIKNTIQVGD